MIVALAVLLGTALWCWALVECAFTPAAQMRSLPKLGWLAVIVLLAWIGAIGWFLLGRPSPTSTQARRDGRADRPSLGMTPRSNTRVLPTAKRTPIGPDDDPEFLRGL